VVHLYIAAQYLFLLILFCSTAPWLRQSVGSEGNVLHVLEDGNEVLIMEMASGKLQVVAGTAERLFIKLADETAQGKSVYMGVVTM
jgi:hypothetical protein